MVHTTRVYSCNITPAFVARRRLDQHHHFPQDVDLFTGPARLVLQAVHDSGGRYGITGEERAARGGQGGPLVVVFHTGRATCCADHVARQGLVVVFAAGQAAVPTTPRCYTAVYLLYLLFCYSYQCAILSCCSSLSVTCWRPRHWLQLLRD